MANKNTRYRVAQARKAYKKGEATSSFLVQTSRVKNSNGSYGNRTHTITIGAQPRKSRPRRFKIGSGGSSLIKGVLDE